MIGTDSQTAFCPITDCLTAWFRGSRPCGFGPIESCPSRISRGSVQKKSSNYIASNCRLEGSTESRLRTFTMLTSNRIAERCGVYLNQFTPITHCLTASCLGPDHHPMENFSPIDLQHLRAHFNRSLCVEMGGQ